MAARTATTARTVRQTPSARSRTGRPSPGRTSPREAGAPRRRTGHRAAMDRTIERQRLHVTLPMVGSVSLPPPERLAWYAGLVGLGAFGILDWPVVLVISVGHLMSEDQHSRLMRDFGDALEQAA